MSLNQTILDVHEIHEVAPLVASSSLDSDSSIGTASSPTLLSPESLLHDIRSSLGSSHSAPTVKFAPLPQTGPRRKRSLAPLGVPARSRRRRAIQQEGGSLLWSVDPDVPEEDMEDPIVAFAKFVKRTGKTLWRRVRQSNKAASQENVPYSAEPVLDISSTVHPDDMALGEKSQPLKEVVGGEDERGRRASWSPWAERRTLSEAKRRNTSDLSLHSVIP
ncbi:hypothetical protein J3R82DRAFT_5947 [Butyriboletus roseoflavus]|nr:hypothetical protein J3R82DRAFT_5947 [Butyriboletus roseoflavus]